MQSMTLEQVEGIVETWPVQQRLRLAEDIIRQVRAAETTEGAMEELCQRFFAQTPEEERLEARAMEQASLETLASD